MLDVESHDVETRMVYADWLAEKGMLALERAQRWMVEADTFPMIRLRGETSDEPARVSGIILSSLEWVIEDKLAPIALNHWGPTRASVEAHLAARIAKYPQ